MHQWPLFLIASSQASDRCAGLKCRLLIFMETKRRKQKAPLGTPFVSYFFGQLETPKTSNKAALEISH